MTLTINQDSKPRIREAIRKMRDQMTAEEVEIKSEAITKRLMATGEYMKANAVMFYAAKGNEVLTGEMIKAALKEGKTVLLPITNTEKKEIEAAVIEDYDRDLKKGAYGIMEPKGKSEADEKMIGAVIVPGVAFDRQGHRLGYGLGYYDKLLRRVTNAVKIGLAYDFQVVERLPRESHDERMDIIITESSLIRCN